MGEETNDSSSRAWASAQPVVNGAGGLAEASQGYLVNDSIGRVHGAIVDGGCPRPMCNCIMALHATWHSRRSQALLGMRSRCAQPGCISSESD